jgi:hypothetical protein
VLLEAGRMAQSFIRVHRQRMENMTVKQAAVLEVRHVCFMSIYTNGVDCNKGRY